MVDKLNTWADPAQLVMASWSTELTGTRVSCPCWGRKESTDEFLMSARDPALGDDGK